MVQIKKLHSALVGDSHVQLGAVKPPEVHDDGDAAAAALDCWLRAVATWYTMPVLRTETRVVPGALPAGPPLTVTDGVVRLRFAIGGDRSRHAELAVTGVRFMNEPAASAPDASAPWYTQGYASLYKWWKSATPAAVALSVVGGDAATGLWRVQALPVAHAHVLDCPCGTPHSSASTPTLVSESRLDARERTTLVKDADIVCAAELHGGNGTHHGATCWHGRGSATMHVMPAPASVPRSLGFQYTPSEHSKVAADFEAFPQLRCASPHLACSIVLCVLVTSCRLRVSTERSTSTNVVGEVKPYNSEQYGVDA